MLLLYQFQTKKCKQVAGKFPYHKNLSAKYQSRPFPGFFLNYRNLNFRGISLSLKSHFHAMLKNFHAANATAKNIPRKFEKNIKKTDHCTLHTAQSAQCTAVTPDNNNNCILQAKTVETALYLRYLYLQLQYLHYHISFARYFWTNWKNLLFYCH